MQLALHISSGSEGTRAFSEALASLAVPAQAEAGYIESLVLSDAFGNGLWYLEHWRDREAIEHRIRSPRFGELIAMMEASGEQPRLEVHFISQTLGLEYISALRGGAADTNTTPAPAQRGKP